MRTLRSTTNRAGAPGGAAPSRRRWRSAVLAAAAAAALAAGAAAEEATILFHGLAEGGVWLGVQQGFDEATVLARFAGRDLGLLTEPPAGTPPVAVIAAVPPAELAELAAAWQERGVAVLDVLSAGDDDPRRPCRPNLLHVAPSAAMKRDALAQWRRLHPADDAEARAWHPAFLKFSATELNSRFRERHGRPMDDDAWAGWAAVKMVAEAVVRSGSAEPRPVLDYLRAEMAFDGVKGIPLSFRSDGQLRQPVLIVVGDRPVGEAPVAGVADPEDLDSLGEEPACGG